jgi:hypothetical protein
MVQYIISDFTAATGKLFKLACEIREMRWNSVGSSNQTIRWMTNGL